MSSSKHDFERFASWLHQTDVDAPPDVRRLANLVLADFDKFSRTSRQHSQRSTYLVDLARKSMSATHDGPPAIQETAPGGTWPWKRLHSMTLGPFRGFLKPETFDLQKRITLFYGPNGTGKTSFCEGLEYGLLGTVEEAETKRIDARTYLANLHARKFEAPALRAIDHQNREVNVTANPETFRFCFVEKNRIDDFSRIAARPPAQRTELIATLFGMDKFNEFVGHFNESIDAQLVTTATKQITLAAKRTALALDHAAFKSEPASRLALDGEEEALALTHSPGMTYAGLKALIGSAQAPGRLQELEKILNAVPPATVGITRQGLLEAFEEAQKSSQDATNVSVQLQARSSQVSFKDLYTAVLALQVSGGDKCPACNTPVADTTSNPFEKAKTGLVELKELSDLQDGLKAAQTTLTTASSELRRQLAALFTFMLAHGEQEAPVGKFLASLDFDATNRWWSGVYPDNRPADAASGVAVTLEQIMLIADRIALQDNASLQARQERQLNITERDRLNSLQLAVQAMDLKRQQLVNEVAAAKGRIEAFEADNAKLIGDVTQETLDIAHDAPIKVAYDRFLVLLRRYRNQLPGMLMAGLNDTALNLYNEFNRNDLDADKLAALHLPLTGDQKIEIAFRANPQVRVDALRILSEGHIRCLGLAILLAKGQSIQSPLIVFDDAINAIDHDHRGGIRETIFEGDRFADTQIIVTCHSNEFIKDIQQHLPAPRRNDSKVYLLRHHTGDHVPRVTDNVASKNYVVKARATLDVLDHREALASCRQGLEMLSEKVWRWLGSHDLGVLNLQLAGVGAEPGLRNLCEALFQKLDKTQTFGHANKPVLLTAYSKILGIPSTNLVWSYLNKGTHEEADRDDFDADLVQSVVQTLEQIDALDLRVGR